MMYMKKVVSDHHFFHVLIDDFTEQCRGGAVVYLYFYKVSDFVSFSVKHRGAVLFRSAEELLF